ncbi:MAG: tRNA lysidine(34) synthetase TilS [Saccharofermentans sp.]|nr:tRNA lysidine(34) synthetase TilS [Saccharofermentans sp.]
MGLSSFASKINEYCAGENLLSGVSCLIVGLSGGPDSVALLLALDELRREADVFPLIYAVHVNHGIRESAKLDEVLACNLCMRLEIPITTYEFDVPSEAKVMGRGLEETGRILRYRAFDDRLKDISLQNGVDKRNVRIVTAHHKGDLTETFLMNLFRGTGLEGLVSMGSNNTIIRPLLCVSKDEILNYLDDLDEQYAIDETNSDTNYTRNKWRNVVLPSIAEVSIKKPEDAIMGTYSLLSSDVDYLTKVTNKEYERVVKRVNGFVFLCINEVNKLHDAIKTRLIRRLWEECFGNLIDFESIHVKLVMELISEMNGTKYADLAFGRMALATDKYVGFCEKEEKTLLACAMATDMGFLAIPLEESISISMEDLESGILTINLPQTDVAISTVIVENEPSRVYNTSSWFCEPKDLTIEKIDLNKAFIKAGCSKELNLMKTMSDLKVPRDARDYIITINSGNRILWIPGIGHAEGFLSAKSYEAWCKDGKGEVNTLLKITVDLEGRY